MEKLSSHKRTQSGQALIIVLLVMSVALAGVLSVVARSVSEITVTTYEEESLRAFSAAEAGVERLLNMAVPSYDSDSLPDGGSFVADVVLQSSRDKFNHPNNLITGESATFWFVSHSDSNPNELVCDASGGKPCFNGHRVENLCFGAVGDHYPSQDNYPALEVTLYYNKNDTDGDGIKDSVDTPNNHEGIQVLREVYDPAGRSGFVSAQKTCSYNGSAFDCSSMCEIEGVNYAFLVEDMIRFNGGKFDTGSGCWNQNGCLIMLKTRLLYGDTTAHSVGADTIATAGTTFSDLQGVTIDSEGIAGDSTRKLKVFKGETEAPDMFEVAVYSQGGIEKTSP